MFCLVIVFFLFSINTVCCINLSILLYLDILLSDYCSYIAIIIYLPNLRSYLPAGNPAILIACVGNFCCLGWYYVVMLWDESNRRIGGHLSVFRGWCC
jgi:hypothetical protein